MLENGYYVLIVIVPQEKDLRPTAVVWGVIFRGHILQILPKNRLLIVEVREKDYRVAATL